MNIKKMTVAALAATTTATLTATVPQVGSGVTMTQESGSRLVTITYTLSDEPGVVTLDVQTNANTSAGVDDPGWTSIGGTAVCNAQGDVWKKVGIGLHTITWRPDKSWPDHVIADGGARAVVTAWGLDNPPEYMVVDISDGAQQGTQRFYPSVDFLPGSVAGQEGAVTNNLIYKTSTILMRKIKAGGITWTMGNAVNETARNATLEATHLVTLASDYYIGVFPVTQSQWGYVVGSMTPTPGFATDGTLHPMDNVSYNHIRGSNWPNSPSSSSFLKKLRDKTGMTGFELPSEAQWEFAARAGNGSGFWGDGSKVLNTDVDGNMGLLGCYKSNSGSTTSVVGSYKPNKWGLYDVFGNVWEWCLDWQEDNIVNNGGAVNVDTVNPSLTLSGATGSSRMLRGGSWNHNAKACRPGYRGMSGDPTKGYNVLGFRLVCPAELE